MRPSKRGAILDAVLEVVERGGVGSVTFESVGDASGVTKSGLIYHFGTKDGMLRALHERLAERWESLLEEALAVPRAQATEADRIAAYARVSAQPASGAEVLLMLEASRNPTMREPYRVVAARWLPPFERLASNDPTARAQLLAVLAADGLWVSDGVGQWQIPMTLRAELAERVAESVLGSREL